MKLKHILLSILCLGMFSTAEAQLLKKLKRKAERAVERTILKKTDEVVTEKTEQAIDSITTPKSKKDKKGNKESTKVKKQEPIVKPTTSQEQLADLHLQNSVQPYETTLGGSVTFTIAVSNKGPAIANQVTALVKFPSSYAINNVTATQGNYNKTTGVWEIGEMKPWSREVLTIMVTVLNTSNLMTLAEITNSSVKDPDSKPNNGVDTNSNGLVIDDKEDEDDGDGQDVKISEVVSDSTSDNPGLDVKMVMEHKKDKIISYLDFDTMAMRMEYHSKGKNPGPVYWDKDGYIYSGEKGNYYKIPFEEVKNLGKNIGGMFSKPGKEMGMTLPKVNGKEVPLEWPSEPIMYNGYELRVYINKYPMMEWIFVYHPKIFKGADNVSESTENCRGNAGCTKFTATSGDGIGSTILFDSEDRLAEITNPNGASIIYTYEPCTVTLPDAQSFNFKFKN